MKRVAVLGSTGSIGRNALEVIASHPDRLQLVGLAARSQTDLLIEQIRKFSPRLIGVWDSDKAKSVSQAAGRDGVLSGREGLIQLATDPGVDTVVVAMSGCEALIPLMRAIQAGKRIALASKELLVMAGELIMRLVREHGTSLVPIDSEHAGLFQCLQGVLPEQVARLVVTGSGGSLWGLSSAQRQRVTREQVLAHPKWSMGRKITVDSATLMNKGLELIEAHWLFQVPFERLRVVIHPEAVVHAMVELIDGTFLAQMSVCDMRFPIQYALSFPERWQARWPQLELTQLSALQFFDPDLEQFPCLGLAMRAFETGGSACAVLNGANETAVGAYLEDQLLFADIPRVIAEVLEQHTAVAHPTLDEILAADSWSRKVAAQMVQACSLR